MLIKKGYLELHVLAARNIPNNPGGLPDTYVKTYLKEGERRFLKKKSRLVVANRDPFFKHRVKYLASDLPRRLIVLNHHNQNEKEHDFTTCSDKTLRPNSVWLFINLLVGNFFYNLSS